MRRTERREKSTSSLVDRTSRVSTHVQMAHALESLLELSRKLPALSPVGRFTSLMRFATARTASAEAAINEDRAPASSYRRRGSSRHGHASSPEERPPAQRGRVGDGEAEQPPFPSPRGLGGSPRRSRVRERDRGAGSEAGDGEVSLPARRGSAPPTPSRTAGSAAERPRASWSPAGSRGRGLYRGRARSEDVGTISRGNSPGSGARPISLLPTEDQTAGAVTTGGDEQHAETEGRRPRSRGPSLPSVSVLVANGSNGRPGAGGQERAGTGFFAARDEVDGGEGTGTGRTEEMRQEEAKEHGLAGTATNGVAGTTRITEGGPFEEDLLGEGTTLAGGSRGGN